MHPLPDPDTLYDAIARRDASFEGVFFVGVRTTGVFCRPGCPAKVPLRRNCEFFPSVSGALHAGYRPCRRCRPTDPANAAPDWVRALVKLVEDDPSKRWRSADLRARSIDPATAARAFKRHFGMTFQAYSRATRMGLALSGIRKGDRMTTAMSAAGFASESGFRDACARLFGYAPQGAPGPAPLAARWIETPLGPALAIAGERGLVLLEFVDRRALATQIGVLRRRFARVILPDAHGARGAPNPHLDHIERDLARYFEEASHGFTVPIEAPGTDFQRKVWDALQRIPVGQTRSYAQIARDIGRPSAVRAVARANGDNRLAILIPCHRVIGSDGTLTGYGGGVWRKDWLLRHEQAAGGDSLFPATPRAGPEQRPVSARDPAPLSLRRDTMPAD